MDEQNSSLPVNNNQPEGGDVELLRSLRETREDHARTNDDSQRVLRALEALKGIEMTEEKREYMLLGSEKKYYIHHRKTRIRNAAKELWRKWMSEVPPADQQRGFDHSQPSQQEEAGCMHAGHGESSNPVGDVGRDLIPYEDLDEQNRSLSVNQNQLEGGDVKLIRGLRAIGEDHDRIEKDAQRVLTTMNAKIKALKGIKMTEEKREYLVLGSEMKGYMHHQKTRIRKAAKELWGKWMSEVPPADQQRAEEGSGGMHADHGDFAESSNPAGDVGRDNEDLEDGEHGSGA